MHTQGIPVTHLNVQNLTSSGLPLQNSISDLLGKNIANIKNKQRLPFSFLILFKKKQNIEEKKKSERGKLEEELRVSETSNNARKNVVSCVKC